MAAMTAPSPAGYRPASCAWRGLTGHDDGAALMAASCAIINDSARVSSMTGDAFARCRAGGDIRRSAPRALEQLLPADHEAVLEDHGRLRGARRQARSTSSTTLPQGTALQGGSAIPMGDDSASFARLTATWSSATRPRAARARGRGWSEARSCGRSSRCGAPSAMRAGDVAVEIGGGEQELRPASSARDARWRRSRCRRPRCPRWSWRCRAADAEVAHLPRLA